MSINAKDILALREMVRLSRAEVHAQVRAQDVIDRLLDERDRLVARVRELETAADEMCATLGTTAHLQHVSLHKRLSAALNGLRSAIAGQPWPAARLTNVEDDR
jgi:hypothetical protein